MAKEEEGGRACIMDGGGGKGTYLEYGGRWHSRPACLPGAVAECCVVLPVGTERRERERVALLARSWAERKRKG